MSVGRFVSSLRCLYHFCLQEANFGVLLEILANNAKCLVIDKHGLEFQ